MTRKVVHIIKGLGRGGAEVLLAETLRLHRRDRFEFHFVYYYESKNDLADALRALGGKVWCLRANSSIAILCSVFSSYRLLVRIKPDLIHAHMPVTGFLARCLAKMLRVPVVYTEHYHLNQYGRATAWLNKLNYRWNSRVIAVSDVTAAAIRAEFPDITNLTTVFNGVNTEVFCRTASGISARPVLPQRAQTRTVVGTIAVFRKQKRLDLWVALARELQRCHPDFYFLMIGHGPEDTQIRKLVKESGVEDLFLLPGLVENTRDYLAQIDLFLMTSELEGLPIALLEAMSMECAPVCTPVGGICTLIQSGTNGLFIDTNDLPGSALAISRLVSEPSRLLEMKSEARKTVVQRFSMHQMVGQLEEIYEEVLSVERKG